MEPKTTDRGLSPWDPVAFLLAGPTSAPCRHLEHDAREFRSGLQRDERRVAPAPSNVPDIGAAGAGFAGRLPRRGFRSTYSVF